MNGPLTLHVFLFGLAPRGVYLAALVTDHAGELLPHHFTHHPFQGWNILCCTCRQSAEAKSPVVIRLAALWCSDFPLLQKAKVISQRALLQGVKSIAKNVEQTNLMLTGRYFRISITSPGVKTGSGAFPFFIFLRSCSINDRRPFSAFRRTIAFLGSPFKPPEATMA